jgi:hypothetical protein
MVAFFLPGERDLRALSRLDPDRDWRQFLIGERAWILQTYLRLAAAGHAVSLVATPPASGTVIFHAKQEKDLLRAAASSRRVLLVGVRADNREPLAADVEVVQNGVFADSRRRHFLPHWPQPGLLPRDPSREERVETVAFKGFASNLAPAFRAPAWRELLAKEGLRWQCDATEFSGPTTDATAVSWADFRAVDLLLALRPAPGGRLSSKPATKLFNAWQAGVPALLGAEPAFREQRRSPLDYLEIHGVADALAAACRLRDDQALYRAMVERGRVRGAEFTVAATTERWRRFLFETLPALAPSAWERTVRVLPFPARRGARFAARLLSGRPAR